MKLFVDYTREQLRKLRLRAKRDFPRTTQAFDETQIYVESDDSEDLDYQSVASPWKRGPGIQIIGIIVRAIQ